METKTLKSKSPLQGQKVTDKKLCDETRVNLSGAVFGTDETTEKKWENGIFSRESRTSLQHRFWNGEHSATYF